MKLYCGGHLTRFSALPVLTYLMYAALRFSKTTPYAFAAATFQTGSEKGAVTFVRGSEVDVNRPPDPILKLMAVAPAILVSHTAQERYIRPWLALHIHQFRHRHHVRIEISHDDH